MHKTILTFRVLRNRSILPALAVLMTFLLVHCAQREDGQRPFVIGGILSMTGGAAQYGEETRRGIDVAVDYLNANRSEDSVVFAYDVQDSESNPAKAQSALLSLRARNAVEVIVSQVSGVVLALAPLCEREHIVLMNSAAQNPKVATAGSYLFSTVNLANVESKQVAEYAYQDLGIRKAGVLYASASYGQGARDIFVEAFKALGGEIVAEAAYPVEGTDYRAQITQVQKAAPEAVFLPGTTQDMARVLRQSYEVGFRPQWLSYTAFEGEEILSLTGDAAEGVIFSSAYLGWDTATGLRATFRDDFNKKFGKFPSVYAANAFDAVLMVAKAVNEGATTGDAIREALLAMPPFDGVSGVNKFDANGTVEKPLVFRTVNDGVFVSL